MCCCYVDQCCCGCSSHKTGVIIWAILDALLNLGYAISGVASIGLGGPHIWSFVVVLADILLAIGAHTSNTGLIIVWLVVMMISIVLLFILLLLVILVIAVGATWLGITVNECSSMGAGCEGAAAVGISILVVLAIMALIMPIISIYFWIVVNSLRKKISEERNGVLPVQINQPGVVFLPQQPYGVNDKN